MTTTTDPWRPEDPNIGLDNPDEKEDHPTAISELDALRLERLVLQGQVLELHLTQKRTEVQTMLEKLEQRYQAHGWTLDLTERMWRRG